MLKELGVGALFLLAGFEIDLATLKSKQAATGFSTWLLCMVSCLVGAYFLLNDLPGAIVMAIALTSTALAGNLPALGSASPLAAPRWLVLGIAALTVNRRG